jgi:GNAT superfamily N-acetyltransferase
VTTVPIHQGDRTGWLALTEGHPTGLAWLDGQAGAPATLTLSVHPAERRRGLGTRLLSTVLAAARERGCSVARCDPVDLGSPGDLFLAHHGFAPALELVFTRLDLRAAPPVDAGPVPAYRVTAWWGEVPEDLAATFAAARPAMDDMPLGDLPSEAAPWDVERLRAVARAVADRGEHLLTVAVVHEATGELAAFTELVVPASGDGEAQHYGTAVVRAHRGLGLARWIKAETVAHVRERFPDVRSLLADTAAENQAMRSVNASLGYEDAHRARYYQLVLEDLSPEAR